jgi:CRISPR-associated protein Csm1
MANMRKVYLTLEARLDELKERKWQRFLTSPDFFVSTKDEWEACPVCKLQATAGICSQCDLQARIGRLLPQVDYLVLTSSQPTWKDQEAEVLTVPFDFGDGPIYAALLTARAAKLLPTLTSGTVYRLNDTDFLCEAWPHLGQGFRFLANTVPHVLGEGEQLVLPGRSSEEAVGPGEGLDFEEIAYLSTGSKKLGVLKADVDHLGLLFSEGLEPLTISRLAALSGAIDRFFSGYINVLADAVSNEWKTHNGREHPWCGKVSGLFYVTYSGGDDLLIIGPWDAVMALARCLEADWRKYACQNPDVTLSAGVVLVKPHHPIQRMAIVVNAAEKRAKNDGRRRIHIFAQNVLWQPDGPEPGFGQILDYARGLADAVGEQELPRSFVHYVGRLYDEHFIRKAVNGKPNLMFLPKLYYAVKRRVRKEVAESLGLMDMLWKCKMMWYAPVLVSYVSLITRKE